MTGKIGSYLAIAFIGFAVMGCGNKSTDDPANNSTKIVTILPASQQSSASQNPSPDKQISDGQNIASQGNQNSGHSPKATPATKSGKPILGKISSTFTDEKTSGHQATNMFFLPDFSNCNSGKYLIKYNPTNYTIDHYVISIASHPFPQKPQIVSKKSPHHRRLKTTIRNYYVDVTYQSGAGGAFNQRFQIVNITDGNLGRISRFRKKEEIADVPAEVLKQAKSVSIQIDRDIQGNPYAVESTGNLKGLSAWEPLLSNLTEMIALTYPPFKIAVNSVWTWKLENDSGNFQLIRVSKTKDGTETAELGVVSNATDPDESSTGTMFVNSSTGILFKANFHRIITGAEDESENQASSAAQKQNPAGSKLPAEPSDVTIQFLGESKMTLSQIKASTQGKKSKLPPKRRHHIAKGVPQSAH